jgi:hypothetical protein
MASSTESPPTSGAAGARTRPVRPPLAEAARLRGQITGDQVFLGLSAAIVLASLLLSADEAAVQVFGWTVPPLCLWKNLLGLDCPGCGLTRSFVMMGHGAFAAAFERHALGPFLFAVVVAQLPLRALSLWRARRRLAALSAAGPGPDRG